MIIVGNSESDCLLIFYRVAPGLQTTALIGAGFIMQRGGVMYTYFVSVYFARGSTLTHFAAVCGHSIQGPRVTTDGTLRSNQNITLDCMRQAMR